MVALLLKDFICFIIDNQLQVFEVQAFPPCESIFEPFWYSHHNVSSWRWSICVSDTTCDLGILAYSRNHLLYLSDQFPGISDDNYLDSLDVWVNSHDWRNTKSQCFSRAIWSLKQEVLTQLIVDARDGMSLNDGRFVHFELLKDVFELIWDLQVFPWAFLWLKVEHNVFVLELAHALDELFDFFLLLDVGFFGFFGIAAIGLRSFGDAQLRHQLSYLVLWKALAFGKLHDFLDEVLVVCTLLHIFGY